MNPPADSDTASDPTGRVLQLLSLLQRHRRWTSSELGDELGVTPRTVRRDIERLRRLGYPVEAAPGVDGGYRLAAGAHLPPLMFDDEEAVAIAVGLWTATSTPLAGIGDTSLRALAKLETLLPDRLRRRLDAIASSASTYRWADEPSDERVDIDTLVDVTAACRDGEELRFRYVDRSGEPSDRLVEPHRLVAVEERWYLLSWDLRRNDWRTFRADRMIDVRLAGRRFRPRPIPGGDPASFVASNLARARTPSEVTITVEASRDDVERAAPWLAEDLDAIDEHRTAVTIRATRPEYAAVTIARLAGSFAVTLPDDADERLADRLRAIATHLGEATR